jgi:hypothetical protein
MKIKEEATLEDGKLLVKQTHDFNPVLDMARTLRSNGLVGDREKRLVGVIPMAQWRMWARKWGVDPQDNAAMREVVARELANSDNAQYRVWEGRF